MTETGCRHPANGLLPWYLNGTLEGAEEGVVRDHLSECAVCASELDELSDMARAVDLHGLPETARPSASTRVTIGRAALLAYSLAATLVVPALLGLYWISLGLPGRGPAPDGPSPATPPAHGAAARGLRPVAALDLGPGARRGNGSPPVLVLPAGVDAIVISFIAPVDADARYALDLHGPGDALLAREDELRGRDAVGRYTYTLLTSVLAGAGDYAFVVREIRPAGEERLYRYPFHVELVAGR